MNVEELQTKLANHIFKIQHFTTKYDVNCKFLVEVFYQLEEVPFHSEFADTFYHE